MVATFTSKVITGCLKSDRLNFVRIHDDSCNVMVSRQVSVDIVTSLDLTSRNAVSRDTAASRAMGSTSMDVWV